MKKKVYKKPEVKEVKVLAAREMAKHTNCSGAN